MILDFVVTANLQSRAKYDSASPKIVRVRRAEYKLPLGLQINRSTREKFAKFYFSNFIFQVAPCGACREWLPSLDKVHRGLIRTIRPNCLCSTASFNAGDGVDFEWYGTVYEWLAGEKPGSTRPGTLGYVNDSVFVVEACVDDVLVGQFRGDGTPYDED